MDMSYHFLYNDLHRFSFTHNAKGKIVPNAFNPNLTVVVYCFIDDDSKPARKNVLICNYKK